MPQPRVIRKYANRRLYDATASRHVTLEDIRRLIASGEQVQVIDDRSGEDLTRSVLLQIIAEQEQFGSPVLSVQLLEGIIRFYGNPVQDMLVALPRAEPGRGHAAAAHACRREMAKAMEAPLAPLAELTRQNMEMWSRMQAQLLAALNPQARRHGEPRRRPRRRPPRRRLPPTNPRNKGPVFMELKGKTVAVTGAARGIGRALAEEFAAAGANLALIDLQGRRTGGHAGRLRGARRPGARLRRQRRQRRRRWPTFFDRIVADFGRFDGIVNNAGIVRDALLVKAKDGTVSGKMSLEQWQAVIDVNLTGVFLCGREAAERMIRLGSGGVIVNISSISRHGNVGQSNYTAAKAGVAALAVVWARELARYRIRVGAIAPGFTHTGILDSMRPELLEKMVAPVPVGRLGRPEEIAHAARFIFENEFFTGRVLELDGGLRL